MENNLVNKVLANAKKREEQQMANMRDIICNLAKDEYDRRLRLNPTNDDPCIAIPWTWMVNVLVSELLVEVAQDMGYEVALEDSCCYFIVSKAEPKGKATVAQQLYADFMKKRKEILEERKVKQFCREIKDKLDKGDYDVDIFYKTFRIKLYLSKDFEGERDNSFVTRCKQEMRVLGFEQVHIYKDQVLIYTPRG